MMSLIKKLLKPSTSNYFNDKPGIIAEGKKSMDTLLKIWGYEIQEREIYHLAYDYFEKNPNQFNGATKTEELFDIPRLDLDAMLHDFLYVFLNASVSFKYNWKADNLLKKESLRRGKSSWNTGYRFTMLVLKTPVFTLWCYLVKKRRISKKDKKELDRIFKILKLEDSRPWHKKYQGEITWLLIILIIILGYINRTDFFKYFI